MCEPHVSLRVDSHTAEFFTTTTNHYYDDGLYLQNHQRRDEETLGLQGSCDAGCQCRI